jgi:hypothetical protein
MALLLFWSHIAQGQNRHLRYLVNTVGAQIALEGESKEDLVSKREEFFSEPRKEVKFQLETNKEFSL